MNALSTAKSKGRRGSTTEHLHPLERQQRYLSTLFGQLNSYQCVPKTQELHQQIELLRSTFRKLMAENDALITSAQNTRGGQRDLREQHEMQFRKMQQLERSVLEYIGKAKVHG